MSVHECLPSSCVTRLKRSTLAQPVCAMHAIDIPPHRWCNSYDHLLQRDIVGSNKSIRFDFDHDELRDTPIVITSFPHYGYKVVSGFSLLWWCSWTQILPRVKF